MPNFSQNDEISESDDRNFNLMALDILARNKDKDPNLDIDRKVRHC